MRATFGALIRGAVAGAAGVVAMDALWYLRYRRSGGADGPVRWEFGGVHKWDDVSAPGQVGKRLGEGVLRKPLPDAAAAPVNSGMHWGYGIGWGGLFGVAAASLGRPAGLLGPPFGTLVWLTSYAILPLTGVYKPIWQYDRRTLYEDWSAHLAYGSATGLAFSLLTRL